MSDHAIKRAAKLREGIEEYKRRRELHASASQFETRRSELESIRGPFETAVMRSRILRRHTRMTENDVPDPAPAQALLTSVRDRFGASPDALRAEKDYKRMLDATDALSGSLDANNQEAWSRFVAENDVVNEAVLRNLDHIPKKGLAAAVDKVRTSRDVLRSVPLPTSEQEYEDAEAAAGNLRKAFDALDLAAALPQDVVELFRAASYRGAPIHLLTPEVLAWLKKHNMEDSVCIVLSRNR